MTICQLDLKTQNMYCPCNWFVSQHKTGANYSTSRFQLQRTLKRKKKDNSFVCNWIHFDTFNQMDHADITHWYSDTSLSIKVTVYSMHLLHVCFIISSWNNNLEMVVFFVLGYIFVFHKIIQNQFHVDRNSLPKYEVRLPNVTASNQSVKVIHLIYSETLPLTSFDEADHKSEATTSTHYLCYGWF